MASLSVGGSPLYSDRFLHRTEEKKSAVSASSFTDFPALSKKNTVITHTPVMAWAHTVKAAIQTEEAAKKAADAQALLEAEREKEEAIQYKSYVRPRITAFHETKGYTQEVYEEEEEGGTPPYGNRGFDDEDTW